MGYTKSVHPHDKGYSVHPHSRGVYQSRPSSYSAPRRFIPTRVGYTVEAIYLHSKCYGSSPLAWGIHSWGKARSDTSNGSSPLAWGILLVTLIVCPKCSVHPHSRGVYPENKEKRSFPVRFIPTRVGYTLYDWASSASSDGSSPLAWGIPRQTRIHGIDVIGSSPLAWGIQIRLSQKNRFNRFIPTRVGYTLSESSVEDFLYGSSPLAWGILIQEEMKASPQAVHPHSRGVYLEIQCRLRGRLRFIPTRVGYTTYTNTTEKS